MEAIYTGHEGHAHARQRPFDLGWIQLDGRCLRCAECGAREPLTEPIGMTQVECRIFVRSHATCGDTTGRTRARRISVVRS